MKKQKQPGKQAYFTLIIATFALTINFWAWSLISPLGAKYADEFSLDPFSLSLLLAMPVIVGSLGRIILGVASDKFGGRLVFSGASLVTMGAVIALSFVDSHTYLILAALLLGVGGATFAIGIPFVGSWFPPGKRGLALGIYSMGNIGTALSGFLTPRLVESIGRQQTFLLVAVLLLCFAILFITKVNNAPGWRHAKGSAIHRLADVLKNTVTRDLSIVYLITFGAFVAFGVYLPVLLKISYDLSLTDAASRAAGFIVIATLARPAGGWLSDKIGGTKVIQVALVATTLLAGFVSFQPTLHVQTTIAYLSLAFALGCCNGAVFALVGKLSKPDSVGSVTGVVGAIGGLGGFIPPLILGFTYQQLNSYSLALSLLAVSAAVVFIYNHFRFKNKVYRG
jgi:NNP family nitrate/nitrite transporter-like MFS transporter